MNDILIKRVSLQDKDYQQVYNLREEILRKPIGLSLENEDLSGDALDTIFCAMHNGIVIGCLMLHPADSAEQIKFRQMAVAADWQGKGIGQLLIDAAEKHTWETGQSHIVLHARVTAQAFYEKLGYKVTSSVFTEVGIPHVVMEKLKP